MCTAWETHVAMETEKLNHSKSCFVAYISLIYFSLI